MNEQELIKLALRAMEYAYVPYSHFPVGAALLGSNQAVYTGCNVENAAYGSSICAERTALLKAVSEGCQSFEMLAIVSRSNDFLYPCGACLQMFSEFAPDLMILCARADGTYQKHLLSEFLPLRFDNEHIEHCNAE